MAKTVKSIERAAARAKAEADRAQQELRLQFLERVKAQAQAGLPVRQSGFKVLDHARHYARDIVSNIDNFYLRDLSALASESRRLYLSSAVASGIVGTMVTNVIGKGLMFQAAVDRELIRSRLGWSDEYIDAWEEDVERRWDEYWNSRRCDYYRDSTGPELEALAYRNMLLDGDCLCIFRGGVNDRSIQLVAGPNVRSSESVNSVSDTMRAGVEIDPKTGRVIRYHVQTVNRLTDGTREVKTVPAVGPRTGRTIATLLKRKQFITQTRGYPFIAPVAHVIRSLSDYMESEKIRAWASSLIAFFIKKREGSGPLPLSEIAEIEQTPEGDRMSYDIKAGSVIELDKDDEGVDFANPNAPNSQYQQFIDAGLREIGLGCQIPKSVLVKENNSSYSAAKADRLEAFRFFFAERRNFVQQFHRVVYENFLTDLILTGQIDAPGFLEDNLLRKAFLGSVWEGETPGQIDPVKDTTAARLRNESFFTTITSEAAYLGQDLQKNIRRSKREKAMFEAAGLPVPAHLRGDSNES